MLDGVIHHLQAVHLMPIRNPDKSTLQHQEDLITTEAAPQVELLHLFPQLLQVMDRGISRTPAHRHSRTVDSPDVDHRLVEARNRVEEGSSRGMVLMAGQSLLEEEAEAAGLSPQEEASLEVRQEAQVAAQNHLVKVVVSQEVREEGLNLRTTIRNLVVDQNRHITTNLPNREAEEDSHNIKVDLQPLKAEEDSHNIKVDLQSLKAVVVNTTKAE
jgi:hypothetical protein